MQHRTNATAPTLARAAHSEAERAEGGTSGTLVTEILGAPQRETVKEELVKCVLAPRPKTHHPPRDGSADFAEENSVPDGQAKSEQAPIRRPPCARRATAPERAQRFSLWTVHGPFLFWNDKREMGGASWLDKPPGGSQTSEAAVRRPIPFQGVPNAIQLRCSLRPSR